MQCIINKAKCLLKPYSCFEAINEAAFSKDIANGHYKQNGAVTKFKISSFPHKTQKHQYLCI